MSASAQSWPRPPPAPAGTAPLTRSGGGRGRRACRSPLSPAPAPARSSTDPRPAAPPASTAPTDQPSICPHLPPNGDAMTATIEGELIAAPSSAEMSSWKSRISALEASDPERAELEITDALTFSNEMLRAVSDVTAQSPSVGADLASAGIGAAKLTAVRAAEFAKRLDLSKDTVLEAQMQQRRWERALGTAIREGQAAGEITSPEVRRRTDSTSTRPTHFASQRELTGQAGKGDGIYALTDNTTDAEFESALTTARDEGNVSRANVVRKLKADGVVDMEIGRASCR